MLELEEKKNSNLTLMCTWQIYLCMRGKSQLYNTLILYVEDFLSIINEIFSITFLYAVSIPYD